MPRNHDIKKDLVIGSGPIVIGQAAEFDYAGTQACRSLKEEGVEVCLVNSNPATIMTDKEIADQVYIEPLTVDVLKEIILKEKPANKQQYNERKNGNYGYQPSSEWFLFLFGLADTSTEDICLEEMHVTHTSSFYTMFHGFLFYLPNL